MTNDNDFRAVSIDLPNNLHRWGLNIPNPMFVRYVEWNIALKRNGRFVQRPADPSKGEINMDYDNFVIVHPLRINGQVYISAGFGELRYSCETGKLEAFYQTYLPPREISPMLDYMIEYMGAGYYDPALAKQRLLQMYPYTSYEDRIRRFFE